MLRGEKYRQAFLEDMAAASQVIVDARAELQGMLDKDEALPSIITFWTCNLHLNSFVMSGWPIAWGIAEGIGSNSQVW